MSLDAAVAAAPHVILPLAAVLTGFVAGRVYGSLDVLARLFTRGEVKK